MTTDTLKALLMSVYSQDKGHLQIAKPILNSIIYVMGALSALAIIGGIIAVIQWNALSPTTIKMFGAEVSTRSVGVAFAALGILGMVVTIRSVLKYTQKLAEIREGVVRNQEQTSVTENNESWFNLKQGDDGICFPMWVFRQEESFHVLFLGSLTLYNRTAQERQFQVNRLLFGQKELKCGSQILTDSSDIRTEIPRGAILYPPNRRDIGYSLPPAIYELLDVKQSYYLQPESISNFTLVALLRNEKSTFSNGQKLSLSISFETVEREFNENLKFIYKESDE